MAASARANVTAHITRVRQDNPGILTVALTPPQILELVSLLTVSLREGVTYKDGTVHVAIRTQAKIAKCQANTPCSGGVGSMTLVRPSQRERAKEPMFRG
jgi:hypothetical protein